MGLLLDYDFRDMVDGQRILSPIGCAVVREDAGVFSIENDLAPELYFYAKRLLSDTFSRLFFDLHTTPGPGDIIDHHGLLCSPGFLDDSNAIFSAQYVNPTQFFSSSVSEFYFQLILGFGHVYEEPNWLGGMIESRWIMGSWQPRLRLGAVHFTAGGLAILGSEDFDGVYADVNELTVERNGTELIVSHNGANVFQMNTNWDGENQLVLWLKAFVTHDEVEPFAVLLSVTGQSVYTWRHVPIKEIPGNKFFSPVCGEHFYRVPIQKLEHEGALVQIGPTAWQFTRETPVIIENDHVEMVGSAGSVIVSHRHLLDKAQYHLCKVRYT